MHHVVHVSASSLVPVAITSFTRVFLRRRRSPTDLKYYNVQVRDQLPAESEYNHLWEVSLAPVPSSDRRVGHQRSAFAPLIIRTIKRFNKR